jgi:aspartyl-tRNA(Asn)/glutamyl-tRNA(Gln) amidotransferase subunit C
LRYNNTCPIVHYLFGASLPMSAPSSSDPATKIDPKTVAHVATLARLGLTDDEAVSYSHDLGKILAMVAQLDELDLSGVTLEATNAVPMTLRPDVVAPAFDHSLLFAHAPLIEEEAFRVPKILVASANPTEAQ